MRMARIALPCLVLVAVLQSCESMVGVAAPTALKCAMCPVRDIDRHSQFCNADLVFKGLVLKVKICEKCGTVTYTVKVLEFRGSVKKIKVISRYPCPLNWLQKNKVYIIAAKKEGKLYVIHRCTSWVETWSHLRDSEILGINGDWTCPKYRSAIGHVGHIP